MNPKFEGLISLKDASIKFNKDESTLRRNIKNKKFIEGEDCIKVGTTWVFDINALEREYRKIKGGIKMLTVLLVILFIIGGIYLQVFLSKKESKILCLILPIVTFLISLLFLCQATTFKIGLTAFIFVNIPTMIFLGIYLSCRKK